MPQAKADRVDRLPKEDLTLLLGIHPKDLGKLCGALKQDRMLAVYVEPALLLRVVSA